MRLLLAQEATKPTSIAEELATAHASAQVGVHAGAGCQIVAQVSNAVAEQRDDVHLALYADARVLFWTCGI